MKGRLTSFTRFVQNIAQSSEPDIEQLEARIEQIVRDFETFNKLQDELESLASDETIETRTQERFEFEEAYFNIIGKARKILKTNALPVTLNPSIGQASETDEITHMIHKNMHIKLPTMSLPTFSGSFESWTSFRDAFRSAISDNPSISDAQKLIYLRSCLSGQAAGRIESLETTNENFTVAWNILTNHYDDLRTVVSNRVRAIFELPECGKKTAASLGALVDSAEKHYNALKALKKPLTDVFPIYAITSKLSPATRVLWSQRSRGTELPTTEELLQFLHERRRDLETSGPISADETRKRDLNHSNQNRVNESRAKPRVTAAPLKTQAYTAQTRPRCELCKEAHYTQSCERLVKASVSDRANIIKSAGLCYNCLRANHSTNQCMAGSCKKCKGKRHTLLHRERGEPTEVSTSKNTNLSVVSPGHMVLPTAIINILDREGKAHACRALLDSAAQSNFIIEGLAAKLGISKQTMHVPLTGIAAMESAVNSSITATIQSRLNKFTTGLSFLILPKITEMLPASRFAFKEFSVPKNIRLADLKFHIPAEIDVLIGAQLVMELLCASQITPPGCGITFQKTKFGWVASGGHFGKNAGRTNCNLITIDLRDQLAKFWAIEEMPTIRNWSVEETACEQHYRDNMHRDDSGRYTVRLPFRDNASQLGDSYTTAIKRFHSLERSLARKDDVKRQYKTYELNTVTYGTSPASFLATRTLHQLASDEARNHPLASLALREDFYVDDLLTGAATPSEARQVRDELVTTTSKAGFELRQWASNCKELIKDISECDNTEHIRLDLDQTVKTLGINWSAKDDTISYSVNNSPPTERVTKRTILSEIAKLFDPLSLLGPVIVRAKLIMQRLWQLDSTWDESVPLDVCTAWRKFREELPSIERISFNRNLLSAPNAEAELHGFCDASERAYGACIYLKTKTPSKLPIIQLVCAKSRVAPLKTQTLPRLELCAALLLAQLYRTMVNALRRTRISRAVFWSDSTIALHWINTPPQTLKIFVGHRVAEIQHLTSPNQWRNVVSASNPADLISRGMSLSEFVGSALWRNGLSWLRETEDRWPYTALSPIELPERKPAVCLTTTVEPFNVLKKYSSLRTLTHVIAHCKRFIYNTRNKDKRTGAFTTDELRDATATVIKIMQRESFSPEIRILASGKISTSGTKAELVSRLAATDVDSWFPGDEQNMFQEASPELPCASGSDASDGAGRQIEASASTSVQVPEIVQRELDLLRREKEVLEAELRIARLNIEASGGVRAVAGPSGPVSDSRSRPFSRIKEIGELLPDFQGEADSFETWKSQMEFIRTKYGLDEDSMKILLSMKLKGKAQTWF